MTENNVAAQAGDEPMRAAFEALAVPDGLNVERGFKNGYRDADTRAAYRGFKLAQVSPRATADVERDELAAALQVALDTIDDYLDYEHNGDPWMEDARAMGEMDINDYGCDGRMESARALLAAIATTKPGA